MPRKPLKDTPTLTANGRRVGRPRKQPPPDAAGIIKAAAADGFSLVGVAMLLGVDKECLARWLDEDRALKEAFDRGREMERQTLHNKLYRKAVEGDDKDSLIAAMFLLKSRHGYREGAEVADATSRVRIDINLPGALDPGAYAKTIEGEVRDA